MADTLVHIVGTSKASLDVERDSFFFFYGGESR